MNTREIQTKTARLVFGPDAEINAISRLNNKTLFKTTLLDFWKITLQEPSDKSVLGRKYILKSNLPDAVNEEKNGIRLIWNQLGTVNATYAIVLEIFVRALDDVFEITAQIHNNEKLLIVRELEMPVFDVPLRKEHSQLLSPSADVSGYKFDLTKEPKRRKLMYPWYSMHYLLIDHGDNEGLYLGSHDKFFTRSKIQTEPINNNSALRCGFSVTAWVEPEKKWTLEPIVVADWHKGWKNATKYYRRWADTWFAPLQRPEWTKTITGWILCIMKQQNGEVIWNWDDIDELCDRAEDQGLNMLGLYGWTEGGHDRDYPTYVPLGKDVEKAKQAIKRAQARGIKVILYTNGQLIDIQGEYYKKLGSSVVTASERGEPFLQAWHKYCDAPLRAHALACQDTDQWRGTLIKLAEQVNAMGADGILYDQIGFGGGSEFCFNKEHGHKHPAQVNANGIITSLRRIQEHMEKINPQFIILSESITDCIGIHLDIIWSGYMSGNDFPDLFQATFPEYRGYVLQRVASPVQDEKHINFAARNNYLFEIECRYRADRQVLAGETVTEECYDEIVSRPPQSLIGISFKESAKHIKDAIERRR